MKETNKERQSQAQLYLDQVSKRNKSTKKDRKELRQSAEAQVDLPLFEFRDNLDIERFMALNLNQ